MGRIKELMAKRYQPLFTDRRIDVMSITMWFLLGMWGLLSIFASVTILTDINDWYPLVWGASIGVASSVACVAAIKTFALPDASVKRRIRWKRTEMVAVSILFGLIVVYPALMFINIFDGRDAPRPDLFFLALTYLVVPAWRIGHLASRVVLLKADLPKEVL